MKKLIRFSFQLSLFAAAVAVISCSEDEPTKKQIPTDGLIAEYLFNGNAVDSKNGLDGTVNGATPTTDRHGKGNAAYSFDGNDYISILDDGMLNFASDQDFTISLWVSANAVQNDDAPINDLIRKWVGNAEGYPYSISYMNSTSVDYPSEILAVRSDGQVCANAPTISSDPIATGEFTHVIFTKKGVHLRLAINGEFVSSVDDYTTTNTSCGTENESHVTIGCRGQLARFFQGKIDDVRFYNRGLDMDEIIELYEE